MKRLLILFACLLSIMTYSCIDEVDLNVDTEQRTLVVDGFVTDSLGNFELSLKRSSVIGIGNDNILDPEPGATVKLMDSNGGTYPYAEMEAGIYHLENFKALRGIDYYIDIVLADGKHYQSRPESLRSASTIDSVKYDVVEETYRNNIGDLITERLIKVRIDTDFSQNDEAPFLRWRIGGQYQFQEIEPGELNPKRCYISVNLDLNAIRIADASNIAQDKLINQEISSTTFDDRFGDQFCYHISQFSISEDEYIYWRNIKDIIDIDGSLFDPPPGTVVGNLFNVDDPTDVAVGYFSVASVYFTREFVNSNELGVFVRATCVGFRGWQNFGCDDCLKINNSTLERPPYWEF